MDDAVERNFNIRLVQAVRKFPVIYNTKLKDFRHKESILAREEAWKAIAEKLNSEDVLPLQRRWKRIRTTLQQALSQKKKFEYGTMYYLYDHLKFLMPFVKISNEPRRSNRNIKYEKSDNEEEKGEEYEIEAEDQNVNILDESAEEYEIVDETDDIDQDTMTYENYDLDEITTTKQEKSLSSLDREIITRGEPAEKASDPRLSMKRKRNEPSNGNFTINAHSTPLSYATHVASSSIGNAEIAQSPPRRENAKKDFLLSLIPDLNEMSNSQMRHFKCKVVELIDEILTEN